MNYTWLGSFQFFFFLGVTKQCVIAVKSVSGFCRYSEMCHFHLLMLFRLQVLPGKMY